jgi:RHS repeat-associated protein
VGNRATKTIGGTNTQYTYGTTSNRLTKISGSPAKTITSDANGSITNNGTNQFTYDARERLVSAQTSIGTVQYKYNALGQRVSKTTPTSTTVFHYDQTGQLIGEKNGTNTIDYIYLNTIPVAIGKSSTPQMNYINADQLNTPRVITNETGTTLWQWDGEAFGNTPPNENPSGAGNFAFNLRFPGQYFDVETNLNQNYYRDYDPTTGRYIESDPLGLYGGQISTYAYVGGNPISHTDPKGLDVYVANTSQVGGFHQKIVVDTPNGAYGQSFGMSSRDLPQQGFWEAYKITPQRGLPGSGEVYSDSDSITKTQQYFKTTPEEDARIEAYLKSQLGNTGPYNVVSNSCRDYSNHQYDVIVRAIQNSRGGM